jgi:hypothetical protein
MEFLHFILSTSQQTNNDEMYPLHLQLDHQVDAYNRILVRTALRLIRNTHADTAA